jgi:NADP-dependent 3-hydroxy acid dehydrogenase YdfG
MSSSSPSKPIAPFHVGYESRKHRKAYAPVNLGSMRPRSILITGASSGIGRALALEYARAGARVALCARRTEELEAVAAGVRAAGGQALPMTVDVTDTSAVSDAVRRADHELGGLEMVVANAGRGDWRHASQLRWQDVEAVLDVNVKGAMATLIAAVPVFLAHQGGHLVAVTSLAGRRGLPMSAAYCASKSATTVFLESLRIDLAAAGIRVTDVQPGFVSTSMTENVEHPTPFRWTADKAARHIARRLERGPAVIAFPWTLAFAASLARLVPAAIYDRIARVAATSA